MSERLNLYEGMSGRGMFPGTRQGKKFIDIPMPSDHGIRQQIGGFDATHNVFRVENGRPPSEIERYMRQTCGPMRQSDLEFVQELASVTPSSTLAQVVDINSLSKYEALKWRKIYAHAAENGQSGSCHAEERDIDECWRRSLQCCIRAFSIVSQPADLLFTDIMQGYYDRGLTRRFPEETVRLLEIAVQMEMENGSHRYEFFDAYFEFQLERGRTADALRFIREHPECFLHMNLTASKAFGIITKKYSEGDVVRLRSFEKAVYAEGNNLERAISSNPTAGQMLYGGIREYVLTYCIAYKGDYAAAKRVASNPKVRELGTNKDWEFVDKSINGLVPDFYGEMSMPMGLDLDRLEKIVVSRDKTSAEALGVLRKREYEAAVESGDIERCLRVVEASYNNDREDYYVYFNVLDIFLGRFAHPDHATPNEIIETFEKLFRFEREGRLRVPLEVKNICMARLAEARFELRQYQQILEEYKGAKVRGRTVLRGEAYYAMEACFAMGIDLEVAGGIGIICAALPQFADTDWEYEIWKKCLLPVYERYKALIHETYSGKRAVPILTEVIDADPENATAHLARIEFALAHSQHLASLPQYVRKMVDVGVQNDEIIIKVARRLRGSVKLAEAVAVLKVSPKYTESAETSRLLCELLLTPPLLTQDSYREAFNLAGGHSDLHGSLKAKFATAREILKIETFEQTSLSSCLNRAINRCQHSNVVPTDGSVTMSVVFGKLRDVAEFQKDELRKYADTGLNWELLQAECAPLSSPLADIFGIERMRFEPRNGNLSAVCTLKREILTLDFSPDNGLAVADIEYAAEDEAQTKIFMRLLEAAVVEEILARLGGKDQAGFVAGACVTTSAEVQKLRRLITEYERTKAPFYSEKPGMEGMEERNRMVCARIAEALDLLSKHPNFPAREELIGLIQRYIEIIKTCRDLDEPVTVYNSAIDHTYPLACYIKYLRIFSAGCARSRLRKAGAGEEVLENFGRSVSRKGNLAGYYELVCYFEDMGGSGEVPISVFLDNKGMAEIPGINKDHSLYEHLWMLALESLMMKVVPEMGPFTKIFGKRNFQHTGRQSPFLSGDLDARLSQDFRISSRRRVCCSALVLAAEQLPEASNVPARKIDVLDDICGAFTLVELSEKDITGWPLYVRDGKRFKKVEGLFVRKDDKTYVVAKKLREVFGSEVGEISGDVVEITALQEGIRGKLLEALRVQVLGGRSYRMPVDFKHPEYAVEIIDGQEYFLIPAEYRRGNTVERDGRLFRLKKVPLHTKVNVEGKTYFALPWQMSDEMDEIYRETATIKVDFSPSMVAYAVLYDGTTHEILAYTYIGSAKDSRVQDYIEATRRGELCTMKDPKAAQAFQSRQGLKEVVFFVGTNTGYKQGVFPPVWHYLEAGRSTHDAAIRLLLDEMGKKIGDKKSGELEQLREELVDESLSVPELSHVKRPRRKPRKIKKPLPQPKIETLQSPNPIYHVEESPRASQYAGLCGRDLYLVEKGHPLHENLSSILKLKPGEVVVLLDKKDGRSSKVMKEFLVEEREDEEV